MQHNIDLKINDKIIERISKIELISKINYLEANNLELVDSTDKLIDIFSMSSHDIEEKYGGDDWNDNICWLEECCPYIDRRLVW